MAILWPRASSCKSRSSKSVQLLWCRITIGWEDTRRGVPEMMNSGELSPPARWDAGW